MTFKELFEEFKAIHMSKYMDTPDKNHLEAFYKFILEKNAVEKSTLKTQIEKFKAAAKNLLHLNNCEMEGIECGMPKPEEWMQGFEQLEKVYDECQKTTI